MVAGLQESVYNTMTIGIDGTKIVHFKRIHLQALGPLLVRLLGSFSKA